MRGHRLVSISFALALPVAACGGGGGGTPDANPPPPDATAQCASVAAAAGSITTFPGDYAGSVMGAGDDLHVATGICTTEVGTGWYNETGPDQVVHLTGLTPNSLYGVDLQSQDDLGFYVITDCDVASGEPIAGQCLVFDDDQVGGDKYTFTAPASGEAWVVVDTTLTDADLDPANGGNGGAYDLKVMAASCTDDSGCTGTPATPHCVEFQCAQCATDFDCTDGASPVCDATGTCVAGPNQCTGDDAHDSGNGDDGPADATVIAEPTAGVPTVVTANICSQPSVEDDWYKMTVAANNTNLGFQLVSSQTDHDLDLYVVDSTGNVITSGTTTGPQPEAFTSSLAAGDYYLVVVQYSPMAQAAATAYTLTVAVPECTTSFDCLSPTAPVCGGAGLCAAGPSLCTGDDAGDTGATTDDGPAGARDITPATVGTARTIDAAVCNDPATEEDWYKVTVLQGEGLQVSVTFASSNLQLFVLDSTGNTFGGSTHVSPETTTLTYLPAGVYYIDVINGDATAVATSVAYTLSVTRTTAQVCASADDCDNAYSTQLFRGNCVAGACQSIPAGTRAAGALCDSSDDCQSGICSYGYTGFFFDNAHLAVCSATCTTQADCDAVGANLRCSTSTITGVAICVPTCTTDLDCGADPANTTLTSGQPWGYYVCTPSTGVCGF